jgi:hypothetical protein
MWWDGTRWVPAMSPDGLWRWNGAQWVPVARQRRSGGTVIGAVVGCAVVFLLTSLIVVIVLLTMGHQISNVFSNVVAALNG